MDKRFIASFLCLVMLLALGSGVSTKNGFVLVDAVASATTAEETPSSPGKTPSKPSSSVNWEETKEIKRLIALNSVGGDVKYLQTVLNEAGYKLAVDGIVGPKTLAAIEGFQKTHALRVDGIVGPKTIAKLAPYMAKLEEVVEEPEIVEPEVKEPVEEVEEEVDAVSGASIVDTDADFLNSISEKGNWITAVLRDFSFDKDLVLEGEGFENRGTPDRKIGLYAKGEDGEVISYTLTAPKLIIKSPDARVLNGTFVGDLYVANRNFLLQGMKVEGNLYFTNNEARDTFTNKDSEVTGEIALINVDAVSTASIVDNKEDFLKSISKDGNWITALLRDLTFDHEIVVDGEGFENRGTPDRKIGLYATVTLEDGTKEYTHNHTLTAPKLTLKSSPFRMLNGKFVGDIYVEIDNFLLQNVEVEGNIYFANQSAMDTFENKGSTVTGEILVK